MTFISVTTGDYSSSLSGGGADRNNRGYPPSPFSPPLAPVISRPYISLPRSFHPLPSPPLPLSFPPSP